MQPVRVEIGPGESRLGDEWVTVSAYPGKSVDYLCEWGLDRLPFADESVTEIYASHVIEHVGWMNVEAALMEARRVLQPGGQIELHTIDLDRVIDRMREGKVEHGQRHPMITANYRLFAYPYTAGDRACVNWHHGAFTYDYLEWLLDQCGFYMITHVNEPRGSEKHGECNLGVGAWRR